MRGTRDYMAVIRSAQGVISAYSEAERQLLEELHGSPDRAVMAGFHRELVAAILARLLEASRRSLGRDLEAIAQEVAAKAMIVGCDAEVEGD